MVPVFVGWQYVVLLFAAPRQGSAFSRWKLGPRAIMPLHLFKRNTEIGASVQAFFVMTNLIVATYYLPYYYQASKNRTPTQSGIDILPLMLTIILSAAGSGAIINFTGRYIHFLRWGPLTSAVGAGLFYTIGMPYPKCFLKIIDNFFEIRIHRTQN